MRRVPGSGSMRYYGQRAAVMRSPAGLRRRGVPQERRWNISRLCHSRRQSHYRAPWCGFVADSALEESGFEPLVPTCDRDAD
jgi:hypothetical protein